MARPPVSLLNRQIIRDTALSLVDEYGLDNVSMRKLATALSVQAPSLYGHYANKDELLNDLANTIVESVDVSSFASDDWRRALESWGRSYRAVLTAHPNIAPLLAHRRSLHPAARKRAQTIHDGLVRAGWPHRTATQIDESVNYLVVGAAISASANNNGDSFELALTALLDGLESRYALLDPASPEG